MIPEERPQSSSPSRGIVPIGSVQHRWQDSGPHLHPPLLAKQRVIQELLQMGRLRCRQVWVAGASN